MYSDPGPATSSSPASREGAIKARKLRRSGDDYHCEMKSDKIIKVDYMISKFTLNENSLQLERLTSVNVNN